MHRFLVTGLVVILTATSITPCVASLFGKPVSQHDCCDPAEASAAPADSAGPSIAQGRADCCAVAPQPPASLPPVAASISARDAALAVVPLIEPFIRFVATPIAIDRHARSSPRPSLVTVLLI